MLLRTVWQIFEKFPQLHKKLKNSNQNNINITVFDINGRVVKEISKDNFISELFTFDEFPSGIYTVLLNTDNERIKRNIVITK